MKHRLLTIAIGLFGLPLLGTAANAQNSVFDVWNMNGNTINAIEGSWQVTANEVSVTNTTATYDIFVTANPHALPDDMGSKVTVEFFNQLGNPMTATDGGATLFGTPQVGSPGPWTGPGTGSNGNTVTWAYGPGAEIGRNGASYLEGVISLTYPSGYGPYQVDAVVYDGFQGPWQGDGLVPEASSLALLLPGLIPLGIALRKRRKKPVADSS
jgi:hypothetical protein